MKQLYGRLVIITAVFPLCATIIGRDSVSVAAPLEAGPNHRTLFADEFVRPDADDLGGAWSEANESD
jgi:hypothetical protein